MAKNQNAQNIFSTIKDLFQAYIQRVIDIASLAGLEAQLAKKTLLRILVLSGFIIILLTASWLWLLVWFFLYLLSFGLSPLFSAFIICLTNFIFLIGITIYLLKIRYNLSFPATRRQLAHIAARIEDLK